VFTVKYAHSEEEVSQKYMTL